MDQANRLRRVEVEIGVAEAADVEAREGAAERAFDVEAGHPARQRGESGPSYSSDVYPYRNIHKYIKQIFDAFGPKRMFWGTDITRMPCSYRQCVTMFTEELPWL